MTMKMIDDLGIGCKIVAASTNERLPPTTPCYSARRLVFCSLLHSSIDGDIIVLVIICPKPKSEQESLGHGGGKNDIVEGHSYSKKVHSFCKPLGSQRPALWTSHGMVDGGCKVEHRQNWKWHVTQTQHKSWTTRSCLPVTGILLKLFYEHMLKNFHMVLPSLLPAIRTGKILNGVNIWADFSPK